MLRRLSLRDVVIVAELEIEFGAGFTVLTGETGAGKSILIDALQFVLGSRADTALVRDCASRAEVSAEFDCPNSLAGWLDEAGLAADDALLLRRTVDAQGKSRAWINGSPATVSQLREMADHLVDIHGQHAWQSLTRPAAVRALLDAQAGIELAALSAAWRAWRDRQALLANARARSDTLDRERERLAWQVAELAKLAPVDGEWDALNAEHQRRAHAQALLDGARAALAALSDDEQGAGRLVARAMAALDEVRRFDNELGSVADVLLAAQAQLDDAARSLHSYLGHGEPDPLRLAELDARIGAWMAQAKRCRRTPAELPAQLANWQRELAALDASANIESLEASEGTARAAFLAEAGRVSALRRRAVPGLSESVTQAMQQLGMAGGRFEVVLLPLDEPQAHGLESVEFRVAGHAGSAPRPLAKVASGGELSRLALAIAVTTTAADPAAASTLIFDEIDAGVGGTVADSVGRLLKQLGGSKTHATQVLAVTHLAQVAACADRHFVVSKALRGAQTMSDVRPAEGEARVAEIARMLGGERLSGMAHAQALLAQRHVAASVDTIAHAPAAGIADPRPQAPEPRRA